MKIVIAIAQALWFAIRMNFKMAVCFIKHGSKGCMLVGMTSGKILAAGYSVTRIIK